MLDIQFNTYREIALIAAFEAFQKSCPTKFACLSMQLLSSFVIFVISSRTQQGDKFHAVIKGHPRDRRVSWFRIWQG